MGQSTQEQYSEFKKVSSVAFSLLAVCMFDKQLLVVCGPRYFNSAALQTRKNNAVVVIVPSDCRTTRA